jgi:hypothetical protein
MHSYFISIEFLVREAYHWTWPFAQFDRGLYELANEENQ